MGSTIRTDGSDVESGMNRAGNKKERRECFVIMTFLHINGLHPQSLPPHSKYISKSVRTNSIESSIDPIPSEPIFSSEIGAPISQK